MTAHNPICAAPDDIASVRRSLLIARDIALDNVAAMEPSVTRDINQAMATVANHFRDLRCPEIELRDALNLCRYLLLAQQIAGRLDGQYSTDRYS